MREDDLKREKEILQAMLEEPALRSQRARRRAAVWWGAVLVAILGLAAALSYAAIRIGRAAASLERSGIALERIVTDAEPRVRATLEHSEAVAQRVDQFGATTLTAARVQTWDQYIKAQAVTTQIATNELRRMGKATTAAVTTLTARADQVMTTADKSLGSLAGRGEKVLDEHAAVVAELRARLADPNVARLVAGLAATSEASAETLRGLNASREEVSAAAVELADKLGCAVDEYGRLGAEGADFMHGLNKPRTKKEKLWRALIQAAAIAAPVAVRR